MNVGVVFEAHYMTYGDLARLIKPHFEKATEEGDTELVVWIEYKESGPRSSFDSFEVIQPYSLNVYTGDEILRLNRHYTEQAPWALYETDQISIDEKKPVSVNVDGESFDFEVTVATRQLIVWKFHEVGLKELALGK